MKAVSVIKFGKIGDWRRLRNEELYNNTRHQILLDVIKSRRNSWAGNVAHMGAMRNAYKILVSKPEGKKPVGRSRRRWEGNIRT
jgi:hypothetical protein